MVRDRSFIESQARAAGRVLAERTLEVYVGLAAVGALLFQMHLSGFLEGFWPYWLSELVPFVLAVPLFFGLRRVAFRLPRPSERIAMREAIWGEVRNDPGAALAWMVASPSCPLRLRRYVEGELSEAELETFLVLAEDSDLSVDDLIGVVRSL